jgi:hypothetical protein
VKPANDGQIRETVRQTYALRALQVLAAEPAEQGGCCSSASCDGITQIYSSAEAELVPEDGRTQGVARLWQPHRAGNP